jgi:hypothetical protein
MVLRGRLRGRVGRRRTSFLQRRPPTGGLRHFPTRQRGRTPWPTTATGVRTVLRSRRARGPAPLAGRAKQAGPVAPAAVGTARTAGHASAIAAANVGRAARLPVQRAAPIGAPVQGSPVAVARLTPRRAVEARLGRATHGQRRGAGLLERRGVPRGPRRHPTVEARAGTSGHGVRRSPRAAAPPPPPVRTAGPARSTKGPRARLGLPGRGRLTAAAGMNVRAVTLSAPGLLMTAGRPNGAAATPGAEPVTGPPGAGPSRDA